jgi:hypothetical protein
MLGDVFAVGLPGGAAAGASSPFGPAAADAAGGAAGEGCSTIYFRLVELQPSSPGCLLVDPLSTQVALQVGGLPERSVHAIVGR